MSLMLNYVMRYGAPIRELITGKLTALYNNILLEYQSRLIVLMPQDMQVHQVDRHKVTFDEVSVVKFNPSDGQFWKTSNLLNYIYFLTAFGLDVEHLFIDHGKVFKDIKIPKDCGDILVANDQLETGQVDRVIQNLLGLGYEVPPEFPLYDFSALMISDKMRMPMQMELRKLVNTYNEYVDTEVCYILLSYLVSQVECDVKSMDITPKDISGSPMIDDFYVLL